LRPLRLCESFFLKFSEKSSILLQKANGDHRRTYGKAAQKGHPRPPARHEGRRNRHQERNAGTVKFDCPQRCSRGDRQRALRQDSDQGDGGREQYRGI